MLAAADPHGDNSNGEGTDHEAALSRMVQVGAVRLTTIAALLEFQRDW